MFYLLVGLDIPCYPVCRLLPTCVHRCFSFYSSCCPPPPRIPSVGFPSTPPATTPPFIPFSTTHGMVRMSRAASRVDFATFVVVKAALCFLSRRGDAGQLLPIAFLSSNAYARMCMSCRSYQVHSTMKMCACVIHVKPFFLPVDIQHNQN